MSDWFKVDQIGNLQLEITDYCNAFCPQCERAQIHPKLLNNKMITLDTVKNIFDQAGWKALHTILFCGNKDEPTMNPDLIPMIKYIRNKLPKVEIAVASNGGTRSVKWWQEIAQLGVCVKFGFDGLEDTNHIYRVGVKWNHAIRNMKAYIDAGGRAEWQFIIFEHNKHQVEEARQMASDMGCARFLETISNRPASVKDDGTLIKIVETEAPKIKASKKVHCIARITDKPNMFNRDPGFGSIYINADGFLVPCCWMGTTHKMKQLHRSAIGIDSSSHSIYHNSIQDILDGEMFYHIYDSLNEMPVCVRMCGKKYTYQGVEQHDL